MTGGHSESNPKSVTGGHSKPNPKSVTGGHSKPNPESVTGGHSKPNPESVTGGHSESNPKSVTGGHSESNPKSVTGGHSEQEQFLTNLILQENPMATERPISKLDQRTVKQRIIIGARSIKAADAVGGEGSFPSSDKSYFSDRYDWIGERKRLENVLGRPPESVVLFKDEPEYDALENFKVHSALLRRHIHRNHMNSRARTSTKPELVRLENYEIHISEDDSFGAVGRLTDEEQDFISLHSKDAVRLWAGKNDRKLGNKRWAGIVYVIPLTVQLWNETKKGNPFAYSALLAIEKELDELIGHIESQTEVMRNQLDKINRSGIHVGVLENRNPTKMPVRVAGLGFHLLKLLTVFDEFMCYCYTFMNKKIELDVESVEATGFDSVFEMKKKTASNCRIFNQNVYHRAMSIRTLQNSKCLSSDFLEDKDGDIGKKLSVAVAQNMVEPLTPEILSCTAKLKSGVMRNPFTAETTQKLIDYAYKYGLIVGSEHNDSESEDEDIIVAE